MREQPREREMEEGEKDNGEKRVERGDEMERRKNRGGNDGIGEMP